MNQNISKKELVIIIIFFLFGASIIPNLAADKLFEVNEDKLLKENIFFEIGKGNNKKKIELTLNEAELIINELNQTLEMINSREISYKEYVKQILTLLTEKNLLPDDCKYENIINLMEHLYDNINSGKNKLLLKKFSNQNFNLFDAYNKKVSFNLADDDDPTVPGSSINLHVGAMTFWLNMAFGGGGLFIPVPISPYYSEWIGNMTLFEGCNLTSFWTMTSGGLFLPNEAGYNVFMSAIPIPGLETLRTAIWTTNAKSLFGFYLFGITASAMIVNYNFRIPYIMADVNIGIFGADMFIGL